MFTLLFWRATGERAISTFGQTFIALTVVTTPMELQYLNWWDITIASAIAGALAVVKALAVAGVTDGNPSMTSAETLAKSTTTEKNGSLAG